MHVILKKTVLVLSLHIPVCLHCAGDGASAEAGHTGRVREPAGAAAPGNQRHGVFD